MTIEVGASSVAEPKARKYSRSFPMVRTLTALGVLAVGYLVPQVVNHANELKDPTTINYSNTPINIEDWTFPKPDEVVGKATGDYKLSSVTGFSEWVQGKEEFDIQSDDWSGFTNEYWPDYYQNPQLNSAKVAAITKFIRVVEGLPSFEVTDNNDLLANHFTNIGLFRNVGTNVDQSSLGLLQHYSFPATNEDLQKVYQIDGLGGLYKKSV